MKNTIAIFALIRRWRNEVLLMLIIGLVTTPAMAILSENTGQIQGQAPSVTGNVQVVFPDGETALTDNAMLGLDQIPNQFRVSSSTAGLVLQDADGDTGLAALVDIEHSTLSWKYNGTALTSAQLATPFRVYFAGQTLTLDVSTPVTASSTTGLPTTAEPRLLTHSYTLTVASLGVQGQIISSIFGEAQPTDATGTLIVEPPDYSLIMYCGSIVDGIGSSEVNFFGNKNNGGKITIDKLNLVSSVQIGTGNWIGVTNTTEKGLRHLTNLTFIMKDGSSKSCGTNSNTQNIIMETFVVPNNQVLDGVIVGAGNYMHTIRFITKPDEQ